MSKAKGKGDNEIMNFYESKEVKKLLPKVINNPTFDPNIHTGTHRRHSTVGYRKDCLDFKLHSTVQRHLWSYYPGS